MEVCVTGGTGYIGSCLIRKLLEKGYTVRTTVRSISRSNKSLLRLKEFPGAQERLTIFTCDLMVEGSYDRAMDGVQGVFHCAGPVFPADMALDPQATMVDPTVKGILNVLRACLRSSTVKRVVMTSSCSAVRYDYTQGNEEKVLDETCWTNTDYCKENQMWYALAKTVAEREAWKFAEENHVDLVVVNPSYVVGPFPTDLPTSTVRYVLYLLQGNAETYPNQIIGFVHIDDVVDAHILVYQKPEATGRYICSAITAHWRDILSRIRRNYPELPLPIRCQDDNAELIPHMTSTNKITELGFGKFKTVDSIFDDAIVDFKTKGLLPMINHGGYS